ncbi:hypothetical protein [Xanthomonas oryzae pv. oryzae MAFF 311018]|nr:hypothetical protein [Xanthomonas oryzae pv. oryzae MAFF 311018]
MRAVVLIAGFDVWRTCVLVYVAAVQTSRRSRMAPWQSIRAERACACMQTASVCSTAIFYAVVLTLESHRRRTWPIPQGSSSMPTLIDATQCQLSGYTRRCWKTAGLRRQCRGNTPAHHCSKPRISRDQSGCSLG